MQLVNEFVVPRGVDETWAVLTDVERIAPAMPGAELTEITPDGQYHGTVKVKVGPVTAKYGGVASFRELDKLNHHMVLDATGKESSGRGRASALITADLAPEGTDTRVTVTTDLTISGPLAQFGRGAIAEVSSRLLKQFVDQLKETVLADGNDAAAASVAMTVPADGGASNGGPAGSVGTASGVPVAGAAAGGSVAGAPAAAGSGAVGSGAAGSGVSAAGGSGSAAGGSGAVGSGAAGSRTGGSGAVGSGAAGSSVSAAGGSGAASGAAGSATGGSGAVGSGAASGAAGSGTGAVGSEATPAAAGSAAAAPGTAGAAGTAGSSAGSAPTMTGATSAAGSDDALGGVCMPDGTEMPVTATPAGATRPAARPAAPAAEVNLLRVAAWPILKRLLPLLIGIAVVVVLLVWLLG
jgi:carbon monoxide dehydrogenase subunit G